MVMLAADVLIHACLHVCMKALRNNNMNKNIFIENKNDYMKD